ncbi:hypothetical protein GpartN1_g7424.t1 [Galdieria partita]|uniref:Uncharacterized protein n=1 Tax=Galdieria partita TaxID=83374 RepID=A0A9C7Q371_9RHOD|nr:hypothetical protein GpartN1_g7424.t1 [Galdieria partita]
MLRWLCWWLLVLLVCLHSLPFSYSVQQEEAFVPIGPRCEKKEHPTQTPHSVEQHSGKHWKPLNCTPNKEKADLLVQKAQVALDALLSSPLFKHVDLESCQEFRVVEVKVNEEGLNLENGQDYIKHSFKLLEDVLASCGAKKHLDKMIFLRVHLPTGSEEGEKLKVIIGMPVSQKVEKLIQEKNKNPNISLVTYPAKTRVGLEIHHDFPLLDHVSRTRKIMDTRIVFMGAKALENVLSEAGLQPEKSSFYFVSHSNLNNVGLMENELWIDLE